MPKTNPTVLNCTTALPIVETARKVCEECGVAGTIAIADRDGNVFMYETIGGSRKFTEKVAKNKARQAAHTGMPTGVLANEVGSKYDLPQLKLIYDMTDKVFIDFAGGVTIYDRNGNVLGSAGFSNLSAETDEKIARRGIKEAGFLCESNMKQDLTDEEIDAALKE